MMNPIKGVRIKNNEGKFNMKCGLIPGTEKITLKISAAKKQPKKYTNIMYSV